MPVTKFVIRRVQAEDADAIANILKASGMFRHLGALPPQDATAWLRRSLEHYIEGGCHSAYVAVEPGGDVLGYVAVHWLPYLFLAGEEGYVSELFVHPDAAGNGIGTRILEQVIDEARDRDCTRLSLINIRDRESYRRGFYSKRGWQERVDAANLVYPLRQK